MVHYVRSLSALSQIGTSSFIKISMIQLQKSCLLISSQHVQELPYKKLTPSSPNRRRVNCQLLMNRVTSCLSSHVPTLPRTYTIHLHLSYLTRNNSSLPQPSVPDRMTSYAYKSSLKRVWILSSLTLARETVCTSLR